MRSDGAGRTLALAVLLAAALGSGGCLERGPAPRVVDNVAYGVTSVPFRNRWWHFYERGLSWADGGFLVEAESDLRSCLARRQTDSRRARIYGMHFVQCFAHRELGAVLLRSGRLDEAERELRLSMEQEPSAKAEYLLRRLRAQRQAAGGAAAAAEPPDPEPIPIAAPPAPEHPAAALAIDAPVSAAPGDAPVGAPPSLWITGRIAGDGDLALWYRRPGEAPVRIPFAPGGRFRTLVPSDARCVVGTSVAPGSDPGLPIVVAAVDAPRGPSLSIDGGEGGTVIQGHRLWFRYEAASAAGLASLRIEDAEHHELRVLDLDGVRAAGTAALDLDAGELQVLFTLVDRDGASGTVERRYTVRESPAQLRALRAAAVDLPLLSPRRAAMRGDDDGRLLQAMVRDARFRFVDRRADEVLAKELRLVEAGYVDRTTAAHAGARMDCRYVVTGTLGRGAADAECYLRLISCETGQVVATADAYADHLDPEREEQFFVAAAGRLRQAFPVIEGHSIEGHSTQGDGAIALDIGRRDGVTESMRFYLFPEPVDASGPPAATVEVRKRQDRVSTVSVVSGNPPIGARAVSE